MRVLPSGSNCFALFAVCCHRRSTKVTQCDNLATFVGRPKLTVLATVDFRPTTWPVYHSERLPLCTTRRAVTRVNLRQLILWLKFFLLHKTGH